MKQSLSNHQKQFIRNNYLKLTEPEMANIIGTGRFIIQKFKREECLAKYPHNRNKKAKEVEDKMIFNVDELDWVA
jgi:hypothetical protein